MADYSNFPFDMYNTSELVQMMMDSVRVDDTAFANAIREVVKQQKPEQLKTADSTKEVE